MKLTPEIKKRIDNYFSNISEEEYEEIVTNYFIKYDNCDKSSNKEENVLLVKLEQYQGCMLSILDTLKLHDNSCLEDKYETLSEIMFRKMRAYDIDLKKDLNLPHLKPVIKKLKK